MAGIGRTPNASRQRRNVPQRGDWTKLEPLAAPVLPELDELGMPDGGWPFVTRMTWDAWRLDPVTSTWNATDIAYAADTILLHASSASSKANEVRLRMADLGLGPEGRAKRRVLLPDEEAPELVDEPGEPAPTRERPEAV